MGPLGYYFAAACQDDTASVFSTDRTAPLRLLAGHVSDVTSVAWHEGGALLATCSDDRTARLWDMRSGRCVRLFEGSAWPLSCVAVTALSSGGAASSLLAAGSDGGAAYLWDVGTARRIAVLQGHEDSVYSVAFSRDGSSLVSGAADCSMRIFDVRSTANSMSSLQYPRVSATSSASAASILKSSLTSSRATQREATPVIAAKYTFHSKLSPVYCAGFTDAGMIFAGGPFSLPNEPRKTNFHKHTILKI
jgi:transcription initiation factor TFIID subunit 5